MLIEKRFIQDDSRTCYKHSCAKKKLKVVYVVSQKCDCEI